jgi:hypothetical protein
MKLGPRLKNFTAVYFEYWRDPSPLELRDKFDSKTETTMLASVFRGGVVGRLHHTGASGGGTEAPCDPNGPLSLP